MFSVSDVPVEVEVLLRSTDLRLRQTALRLTNSLTHRPFSAKLPFNSDQSRIAIVSLPGGGAAEFARHLAWLTCKKSNARLVFTGGEASTAIGSGPVVLFGPLPLDSDVYRSFKSAIFFSESMTPAVSDDSFKIQLLEIPPLAARPDDSLIAAEIMVRNFFPPGMVLSSDARQLICDFRWPGEFAHLRVTLGVAAQRAFAAGRQVVDAMQILAVINRKELNLAELSRLDQTGWSFPIAGRDLLQLATFTGFSRVKKALELLLIEGAVATAGGSATGAARQLGLPYTTLVSRQKALRSDGTV